MLIEAVTCLHRRHQLLAERHQEQSVEDRESEPARDRLAEDRDHRPLEHQHQAEMAEQRDASGLAEQPGQGPGGDRHQPRRPGARRQRPKLGKPLADQPDEDRKDQKAMVEGRAGPPHLRHGGHVTREQGQDRRGGDSQSERMGPPALRLRPGSGDGQDRRHAAARRGARPII
jgi:hypothetical protein